MKCIILFLLITAMLNLDAQLVTKPQHSPKQKSEPIATSSSLAAATTATQTLTVVPLAAASKQKREKLVIRASLVQKLATQNAERKKASLENLIRSKITQLYPKIPLRILPEIIEKELNYQQAMCYSHRDKTPQEAELSLLRSSQSGNNAIKLSTSTACELTSAQVCIPIINSKDRIASQLRTKYPLLYEGVYNDAVRQILTEKITQEITLIYTELCNRPASRHDSYDNLLIDRHSESIFILHKAISALSDPQDKQLLEETVDIVLEEEPALAETAAAPPSAIPESAAGKKS